MPLGGKVVLLHRWLLGLTQGDGKISDHINGGKLDNRRENLRVVNASESSANVAGRARSGYRGVYRGKGGKWYAAAKQDGEKIIIARSFVNAADAAIAADAWRQEHLPGYVPGREHRFATG
jgi:hypothetical protein